MKHNDIKGRREKRYIALKNALADKNRAISDLGWISLDKPYQNGWHAKLRLRRDVSNREDAWVFQYIVDNFSTREWARTRGDFWWNRKWRASFRWLSRPKISGARTESYNNLPPQVRRWFSTEATALPYFNHRLHRCTAPDFFFEVCYEKNMVGKVRAFDSDLQSERQFIEDKLGWDFFAEWHRQSKAPKKFRKALNKAERRKSKVETARAVSTGEFDFRENHRGAAWLCW
jgi:hypothetical protein